MVADSQIRGAGAPIFFTLRLAQPGATALIDHLDILRQAVRITKRDRPFDILAWVVMPDHMHCIWDLPQSDPNYAQRWGRIKSQFTRAVRARRRGPGQGQAAHDRVADVEADHRPPIWQKRFQDHPCRDAADLRAFLRYCWFDPVRHGLVQHPTDWPASSIHRDIRLGRVDADIAGAAQPDLVDAA